MDEEEKEHKEWGREGTCTNKDVFALCEGIPSQHSVFPFPWLLPQTTHIPSCSIKIGLSHLAQLIEAFFKISIF